MEFDGERLVQSKYQGPQRNMLFAVGCAYLGGLSFGYMIGRLPTKYPVYLGHRG